MEKKGKKNGRGAQLLSILIYLMIGAASGILIVRYIDHFTGPDVTIGQEILLFAMLMLSVYAVMLLQIIIHEGGHLVFGLATGYKFSSFRILSWMFVKEEGKLRIRRLSLAGTGGQCLMAPPDLKDGTIPFLLYNFGGAIMNLCSCLLFGGLSFLFPPDSFFNFFLLVLVLVGAGFAFMNAFPLRLGQVDNDGANALSLLKSREAVRAFWIQMKANEQISRGVRLSDMPEEWFVLPEKEAMNNGITAYIGVLACSRLMDQKRFEEADAMMESLISGGEGIAGLHRGLMICDRIFLEVTGKNRPEALESLLTKEQKKFMKAMKTFPSVLRTEYALALLADKDKEKAEKVRKEFDRYAARYPYPSEIEAEREYMKLAEKCAGEKEAL
jgi:hypothetical protein